MALTAGLRTVTLVTGDHVDVLPDGHTAIRPGANRDSVRFDTQRVAGHTFVIPSDATTLLQRGKLDPRLFDVTQLLAFDYDKRPDLPVIVQGSASTSIAAAVAGTSNAVGTREVKGLNFVAMRAQSDGALWRAVTSAPSTFTAGSDTKVWLDGIRRLFLDQSVPQIGGDVAHEQGFDGTGVKVGVVDTGVDWEHPDLADRVVAHVNLVADREIDEKDVVGHGTHVSSIIAGTGAASNGKYRGVAPGAQLVVAKVCEDIGCPESAILAGMLWTVQQGAKVVNLSLGSDDTPGEDPLEQAINSLSSKYNALFVVAAGNSGPLTRVGSPASADAALAVGAVDKTDALAPFSQFGPRLDDAAFKPEISAPGVDIVAARSQYLVGEAQGETEDLGPYIRFSGTSMATPHVAGSAAVAFQRHPDWSAQQIKGLLINASHTIDGVSLRGQGAGRVDVAAATKLQLTAEPAAVSFGLPQWPHDDDESVSKLVTFDNNSDDDLTVDLSFSATGPDDTAAPAEMFVLSANRIKVPAHDRASVTVSANPRFGTDGDSLGQIIATSGETRLHVPFVVEREVESYTLTLKHLDREGKPASSDTVWTNVSVDDSTFAELLPIDVDATGIVKLRKPKGTYVVSAGFFDPDGGKAQPPFGEIPPYALLIDPAVSLTSDTTVVFDAREAKPVRAVAPLEGAKTAAIGLQYRFGPEDRPMGRGSFQSGGELYTARVGSGVVENPSTNVFVVWRDGVEDRPTTYAIGGAWFVNGDLITGFDRASRIEEFAHVKTHFASDGSPWPAKVGLYALAPGEEMYGLSAGSLALPQLPAAVDIYYHAATPGQRWMTVFGQGNWLDETGNQFQSDPREYTAGATTDETWNKGVFGPSGLGYVGRFQDQLLVSPDWYSDGEGRLGAVSVAKSHLRLLSGGELLAEEDYESVAFNVKPESTRYRAELEVERTSDAQLSTRVAIALEFVSGTSPSTDEISIVPTLGIRFAPELDDRNTAEGTGTFEIPVIIGHPVDLPSKPAEAVTVEVSFDDGVTWSEADVAGSGDAWTATVEHPQQSGFVSLRASAIDGDDNLVEETIIRAYRLP